MQNTWFKCGKIPQNAEGLAVMLNAVFHLSDCLRQLKNLVVNCAFLVHLSARQPCSAEQSLYLSISTRVSSRIFQLMGGSSICATVQPPTLHEVGGGGGNYASTDLIGPVGSTRLVLQFMAVR